MGSRRRLDIGIASYRNPDKLRKTLETIEAKSWTDWRCLIVHNLADDEECKQAVLCAARACQMNSRFKFEAQPNSGYAGAVNRIFDWAETPYVAYLDNDVEILTPGWDEKLCDILDRAPEVAQVYPGGGHYGFHNGRYHECLWNAGYAWVLRKEAEKKLRSGYCDGNYELEEVATIQALGTGKMLMDPMLMHHEEVDLMVRLRLAGYRIACDPAVNIAHHCTSTNSPESEKRIHAGVVRFMNKWNRYFCGDALTYPNPEMGPWAGEKQEHYDPRFLRYTDWPPCALYLERWALAQFPGINKNAEVVQTSAGPMDAIRILKPSGCYRGRAI